MSWRRRRRSRSIGSRRRRMSCSQGRRRGGRTGDRAPRTGGSTGGHPSQADTYVETQIINKEEQGKFLNSK